MFFVVVFLSWKIVNRFFYRIVTPRIKLNLLQGVGYLSLRVFEEGTGGLHRESRTGHPPVEGVAVRIHLLQVRYGRLVHAGKHQAEGPVQGEREEDGHSALWEVLTGLGRRRGRG